MIAVLDVESKLNIFIYFTYFKRIHQNNVIAVLNFKS